MEIDIEEDIISQNENIFKLEYANQNIDHNINALKWKKLMLKKYNNNKNLKLFKCQNDNILFYDNYYENHYLGFCPICQKYICYFCLFPNKQHELNIICCLRRLIYICLFINGPKYIKRNDLCNAFAICLFIPGFNFFFIEFYFAMTLTEKVAKKKYKKKLLLVEGLEGQAKGYFEGADFLVQLLLFIPFFIFSLDFILILIIFSIPFKLIPIKYCLGIFDSKEDSF